MWKTSDAQSSFSLTDLTICGKCQVLPDGYGQVLLEMIYSLKSKLASELGKFLAVAKF